MFQNNNKVTEKQEIIDKIISSREKKILYKGNEELDILLNKKINDKKAKLVTKINELYEITTQINEFVNEKGTSVYLKKHWLFFQKKIYKKLNNKIYKCEHLISNKKYSSLSDEFIIELNNVTKYYSTKSLVNKVLIDVNLSIKKGDFVVIMGPSGSGKTTLMNLISGIDKPTYGEINVAGFRLDNLNNFELTNFRKDVIGYVFQRYGLLANLTVEENVLMGMFLGKNTLSQKIKNENDVIDSNILNDESVKEKVEKILKMVDLVEQRNKYPYEMSGGQKQRVSIARTIAKDPLIVFGDEPTAAVDEEMSKTILESFAKINNELNSTIVVVTHDDRITKYANKVIYVLDGKINNVIVKKKGEMLNEVKKN